MTTKEQYKLAYHNLRQRQWRFNNLPMDNYHIDEETGESVVIIPPVNDGDENIPFWIKRNANDSRQFYYHFDPLMDRQLLQGG